MGGAQIFLFLMFKIVFFDLVYINDADIWQMIICDVSIIMKIVLNINKYYYRKLNTNKMHGRYHDQRVYQHFVHTYSRVPYLDR